MPPRLRSMVRLLSSVRWVRMNECQAAQHVQVHPNSTLNWTLDGAPHAAQQPFMIFGSQSRQPLMGMAELNIVLPREVTRLIIGVREWHGNRRFYCRIDNVFHRSITWSLGAINNHPPVLHGSKSICTDPEPKQHAHDQMKRWSFCHRNQP